MGVIYDTLEGSQVGTDKGTFTGVRGGMITGINTDMPNGMILSQALQQLPAYGSPYPDPTRLAFLTGHAIERIGNSNQKLRFTLKYSAPNGGQAAGSFVIERKKSLNQVTTNLHPKDKAPLKFKWVDPNGGEGHAPTNAELSYLQPQKVLSATGFYQGLPPGTDAAFGCVNETSWQAHGAGYWLFMGADDRTEDYGSSYLVRLEFVTKVTEDWSSWAIFRNPATGATLPVLPQDLKDLRDGGYKYGIDTKNGVIKAGLYPTYEFNSIFPFLSNG